MAAGDSSRTHPDAGTLGDLYEQYYDRIARYIFSRVGDRNLGENLAGEVFLRAVESIGGFRDQGLPVKAWLFRIAHNLVIDHYRRSAKRQSVPMDDAAEIACPSNPHCEVDAKLSIEAVNAMIARLNPAQQEVVALRFIGGLSAEEAGAVMQPNRTLGAIHELQRTALKALRVLLGPEINRFGVPARGEARES